MGCPDLNLISVIFVLFVVVISSLPNNNVFNNEFPVLTWLTLPFDNLLDTLKSLDTSESTIYVIGGGEIYKQTIDTADRLELTVVDCSPEADTFFPDIDDTWKLVKEEKHEKDERHKYSFSYLTYEKKSF